LAERGIRRAPNGSSAPAICAISAATAVREAEVEIEPVIAAAHIVADNTNEQHKAVFGRAAQQLEHNRSLWRKVGQQAQLRLYDDALRADR
jgi:hypothetical protein